MSQMGHCRFHDVGCESALPLRTNIVSETPGDARSVVALGENGNCQTLIASPLAP
jgi:hypothetical protein